MDDPLATSVPWNFPDNRRMATEALNQPTSIDHSPSSGITAVDFELPSTITQSQGQDTSLGLADAPSVTPPTIPPTSDQHGPFPQTLGGGWETWHITGTSNISREQQPFPDFINPVFEGLSGPMSPDSYFNQLLAPLAGGERGIGANIQTSFWDTQIPEQWNWMVGSQNGQTAPH